MKIRLAWILGVSFITLIIISLLFIERIGLPQSKTIPELDDFSGKESDQELKEYFINLATEKGAVYAYEILRSANLRPGVDVHLLGHEVGHILYEQKGAEGMKYCTNEFRNACSHTVAVGIFSEKGLEGLPDIVEACKQAPGGKGAYNMCFHGLGHGVLAYVDYDLAKGVKICSKIAKARPDGREFPECVGGVIMEIISGGDHDKGRWSEQNAKYMKTDDPLYPCNSEIIPSAAKQMCYIYLTPHLIGNMDSPTEQDFKKGFEHCKNLPTWDPNRKVCYAGFGKEFVVLARARDIRNISKLTDAESKKIQDWCELANDPEGQLACDRGALDSIYWGGENDISVAIEFCNSFRDGARENYCFSHLMDLVDSFIEEESYKRSFCEKVPRELKKECQNQI